MNLIQPAAQGLAEETRLVVHDDRDRNYHLLRVIPPGLSADIDDPEIQSRPWDFRYKLQVRSEGRWVDRTRYQRMPDANVLEDHLMGRATLDDDALVTAVRKLIGSDMAVRGFKKVAYLATDRLLRAARTDDSIRRFVGVLTSEADDDVPFYSDLARYLGTHIELKDVFREHGALHRDVRSLPGPAGPGSLSDALLSIAERELSRNDTHQMSAVMAGQLVSLLGDRPRAASIFAQALAAPVDHLLATDVGAHSFLAEAPVQPDEPSPLHFLETPRPRTRPTIVITADTRFFRMYGVSWMYGIAAVKDVDMHIHLVGDEADVLEVVDHALRILDEILAFRGARTEVRRPTWSHEPLRPGVAEPRTFYACARFINARRFMEAFDGPIYLADADMTFTAHPAAHLATLQRSGADAGLVMTRPPFVVMPWRRVMAGSVFLRPSDAGLAFADAAASYIRLCLPRARSWTLDQNALYYALETTDGLDVRPITDRVLSQASPFNAHVERL